MAGPSPPMAQRARTAAPVAPVQQPLPRYAVWNNKGGVGKTFVTFVVAAEYARQHPDRNVIVIDMCPQANVSEILLGGNGGGSLELDKLIQARRTIGGYFDARLKAPHQMTGNEASFLIPVATINRNLPSNMFLVAGDPSLEVQAEAMNQIAAQSLPQDAWANVHRWLFDLVRGTSSAVANPVYFIDTNPSFGAYTELALVAATRLIVPCTADGSSARGINNIGQLLYGVGVPTAYQGVNFATRAQRNGLALPTIHLVPLNRSTIYDNKASKAFLAMYGEIKKRVHALRTAVPHAFTMPKSEEPFFEIPDAHAVSIVVSHKGLPVHDLTPGHYEVHTENPMVNKEPLERYKHAIEKLVGQL